MISKFLRRTKNGNMIQLGDDVKTGKWYYIEPQVQEYADKLQANENVEFNYEQRGGSYYISFLKPSTGASPGNFRKGQGFTRSSTNSRFTPRKSSSNITPEHKEYLDKKQNTIMAEAIGHMTSRTLVALQGIVNEENIFTFINDIYACYLENVMNASANPQSSQNTATNDQSVNFAPDGSEILV